MCLLAGLTESGEADLRFIRFNDVTQSIGTHLHEG